MRKTLVPVLAAAVALGVAWTVVQKETRAASTGALTPQDYADIQQLYATYYQTIDSGDSEAWAGTFTGDGTFNNINGHDALVNMIKNGTAKGTPLRHWQSNLLLTPTPGGATGKVYVIQFNIQEKPITAASYSRYDDTLTRTAQGWRFKSRIRSTDTTLKPGPGAK